MARANLKPHIALILGLQASAGSTLADHSEKAKSPVSVFFPFFADTVSDTYKAKSITA
jgi:hypothetical protein